ncbi:MAG: hypothetical protein ABR555_16495 [Pyrinomonadaceae bacterium]
MAYRVVLQGTASAEYIDSTMRRGLGRKPIWVDDDSSTATVNLAGTQNSSVTVYAGHSGYYEWIPDMEELTTSIILRQPNPQNPQDPPGTPDYVNSNAVKACAEKLFGITQGGLDYQPGNGRVSFQGFDEKQSSMFNSSAG